MSETPEERRERLLDAMWRASEKVPGNPRLGVILDALLDALEPPVADMVRLGLDKDTLVRARMWLELHHRPRGEP